MGQYMSYIQHQLFFVKHSDAVFLFSEGIGSSFPRKPQDIAVRRDWSPKEAKAGPGKTLREGDYLNFGEGGGKGLTIYRNSIQ